MKKKNPIYEDNDIPDKPLRLFLKGVRSLIAKFLKVDPDTIYIDAAYSPGQGKDINCMVIFPRVKEDSAEALEIRRRVNQFAREQGMDLYAGGSANNPGIFVVGPEDAASSGPHGPESVLGIVVPVSEMNKIKNNPREYDNAISDPQVRKFLKWMRRNLAQILGNDPDTIEISAARDMDQRFVYADILFQVYPNRKNLNWPEVKEQVRDFLNEEEIVGAHLSIDKVGYALITMTIAVEEFDKLPNPRSKLGKRKNPSHFKNDNFQIYTWFERDRAHVELRNETTGETVVEWWDEQVAEAIEDGFLDPKNWFKSVMDYAKEFKLIWGENRPRKNPADKEIRQIVLALKLLHQQSDLSKTMNSTLLAALKAEKLWSKQNGVTKKGLNFLKHMGISTRN